MKYKKLKLYLFSLFMSYNILFYNEIKLVYKSIDILLLSIILFIIFKLLLEKLNNTILVSNGVIKRREFIVYFLIILVVLLIDFFGNYPFYILSDTESCIKQVLTSQYSNWHPFFYTFLMIKIPYIFCKHMASLVVSQYTIIVSVLLYFCYFVRKNFLGFKWTCILLAFIVLNPNFLQTSVFVVKDIPFSYFMMMGTIFLIEIYLSKGKWLDKRKNKLLFILICIGISNFRHNGIVCYLLMMLLLIIFYKNYRKFLIGFLVIYIISSNIIFGPIYNKLGIEQHNFAHSEMLGIPFNQFSYLYNSNSYLTYYQLEMMNNLNPLENWRIYYDPKSFNKIKWSGGNSGRFYNCAFAEKHYKEFLKMYIDLFFKYPYKSLKSYVNVTNTIWSFGVGTNDNNMAIQWGFQRKKLNLFVINFCLIIMIILITQYLISLFCL